RTTFCPISRQWEPMAIQFAAPVLEWDAQSIWFKQTLPDLTSTCTLYDKCHDSTVCCHSSTLCGNHWEAKT
ncbi:hypothetical protein CEXT_92021, partial [Caerostris extrusa]